jgi:hypothetical protein
VVGQVNHLNDAMVWRLVKVSRLQIGKACCWQQCSVQELHLSCGMKQVGRTYTAQPKNLAIHSPSFSSENSPTKKEGADFEMNKREIPLAFISFTRATESRLYGSNNFGC